MFIIYQLISPNTKVYFGYTQNLEKRFNYGRGFHANKPLAAAIEHYGWQAFQKTILDDVENESVAKQIVADLITSNRSDNPAFGYNRPSASPSTEAQIIARGLRKPIYQCDLDDNVLVEYKSVNAAAAAINGSPTTLSNCLHGRLKSYKGYHWRYVAQHVQSSQG